MEPVPGAAVNIPLDHIPERWEEIQRYAPSISSCSVVPETAPVKALAYLEASKGITDGTERYGSI